jgi:hypothetical protein
MAIKNLGHYQGVVEDINPNSLQFKLLDQRHKNLIRLSIEKQNLTARLKEIDKEIDEIKTEIKPEIKSGLIHWAWIWMKKATRVKWKEEFVIACGQPKANEVLKKYKAIEYPQISIQYIDPIPESIVQIKENPNKFPTVKYKLSHKE